MIIRHWIKLAIVLCVLCASGRLSAIVPLNDLASAGADLDFAPGTSDARNALAEARRLELAGHLNAALQVLEDAGTIAAERDIEGLLAVLQLKAALLFSHGRYDEAMAASEQMIRIGRAHGLELAVAFGEIDIAKVHRRRGNNGAAVDGFERALQLVRPIGHRPGIAVAMTHLALIHLNQGEFAEALEMLNQSIRLQEGRPDSGIDRTFHYLGLLYSALGEFETAKRYIEKGLQEAKGHEDGRRQAPLMGSLARIRNLLGEHAIARDLGREVLRVAESAGDPAGEVYALLEIGRAEIGLGLIDAARITLARGSDIARAVGQEGVLPYFDCLQADAAGRAGDATAALAHLRKAVPALRRSGDDAQLLLAYRAMVPLLVQDGQLRSAAETALEAMRLQESVSSLAMARRIAVIEAERRTERLSLDLEMTALQLEQSRLMVAFAFVSVAALAMLALLLSIRFRASRRLVADLASANRSLSENRERLLAAHRELQSQASALEQAANIDPLTGTHNRRSFLAHFERHSRNASQDLAVLLIDVDNFKQINDRGGHCAGDAALTAVARTLRDALPASALLARWGGEEFVVLLHGTAAVDAEEIAEALRQSVEVNGNASGHNITVSIGVCVREDGFEPQPGGLITRADHALYRAKASGKNRVEYAHAREPA